MADKKYKIKFEELEAFVIKTIRDPFLLLRDEWNAEKEWLIESYLSEERNHSKKTIKNGEELGIIIFMQKQFKKENVFVFNETNNFKQAISILNQRINDYLKSNLKEIFNLVKNLEAKPCDQ